MRNINTTTTDTTDTTDTTTSPASTRTQQQQQQPTLRDLLAKRAADREQEQRDREERIAAAERARRNQLIADHITALHETLRDDVRAALEPVTHDIITTPHPWDGTDDVACTRWHDAETDTDWQLYYYAGWRLEAPATGYKAELLHSQYNDTPNLSDELLDALDRYPTWLQKHRDAEAERAAAAAADPAAAAAAAAAAAEAKPPRYRLVTDIDTRGEGILHTGSRVYLTYETAETGEYGRKSECVTCLLLDWTPQWLLVQTNEAGGVRLIPRERICYIKPAGTTSKLGW